LLDQNAEFVKHIELLAPAKDYAAAVAAVDHGADAVYIGGARFGARRAAGNTVEEIARVVEYAHPYGVRVHATLNTILYDAELDEAGQLARDLIAAGVDALIVQDMALRRMDLPVELHASTQTAVATPERAVFLERCGFARVILERALSLDRIREICRATGAEVECFVHGAVCVGYSGRCYLSRSMSARSGNRGACSQPCRLPYDLTDGSGRILLRGKHLLSVRDLDWSAHLGELIDAGVTSFKIEGRLKDINYVRNVVSYYRRRLDEALAARPDCRRASVGESRIDFTPDPAKSFTRGASDYFYGGLRRGVASFDTPKAVGEYIGRAVRVDGKGFRVDGRAALAPGDGICFGGIGTRVERVEGDRIVPGRMEGIRPGTAIYRNFDNRFNLMLERSRTRRVVPVRAEAEVSRTAVVLRYTDCEGHTAEVRRPGVFEPASDPGRMEAVLRAQLVRSGDTIFEVRKTGVCGAGWFVPVSLLSEMRREALADLHAARSKAGREHRIVPEDRSVPLPSARVGAEADVTNRLAEAFYRDHGAERIEAGLDLAESTVGRCVMRSAYCIRREIGACLKESGSLRETLFLVHGRHRYRLEFDCRQCEMRLWDESGRTERKPGMK